MAKLLHDLITNAAWKHPQRAAVRCGERSLDFGQLAQGVEQAGRALLSLGLKRGERVAILLDKREEALLAMFGALAAGAAFVMLAPQLKDEQLALVLCDSGARMLVTTPARRCPAWPCSAGRIACAMPRP